MIDGIELDSFHYVLEIAIGQCWKTILRQKEAIEIVEEIVHEGLVFQALRVVDLKKDHFFHRNVDQPYDRWVRQIDHQVLLDGRQG